MFTISDNTPSAGCIQWSNLHMQYLGVTYTIQNGYTNYTYVYWSHSTPTQLVVSNTLPANLTDADCLLFLNKSGTHLTVPTATILDGDLLIPGSVFAAALAANSVTANAIAAGAVTANAIAADAVTANSIATGAITADALSANCIGASAIAANAITADEIVSGAVTADKLAANSVTANAIAANAIGAGAIAAGVITADKLVAGTITSSSACITSLKADWITSGSLSANRISGGTLTLGGSGNGNGSAMIKDTSGGNLISLDNTGINIYNGSITIYNGSDASSNKAFYVNSSGDIIFTKPIGINGLFTMELTEDAAGGILKLIDSSGTNFSYNTQISAGSIMLSSTDADSFIGTDMVITNKLEGAHDTGDVIYIGGVDSGSCAVDVTGGSFRVQADSSNYIRVDPGGSGINFIVGGTTPAYVTGSGLASKGHAVLTTTYNFSWSGTIASGSTVTITHNLGHYPVVATDGTLGNVNLNFSNVDGNSIKVNNFNGGANSWSGAIRMW